MSCKLYFEKSYDYVDLDFLEKVLEKKGLGDRCSIWMRGGLV